jgi:hypothetical protein
MKGVKHYTEDGEYTGSKHKMPDGKSHTGKTHKKVGMKKSPSGRTKNGKVVMVNDCERR